VGKAWSLSVTGPNPLASPRDPVSTHNFASECVARALRSDPAALVPSSRHWRHLATKLRTSPSIPRRIPVHSTDIDGGSTVKGSVSIAKHGHWIEGFGRNAQGRLATVRATGRNSRSANWTMSRRLRLLKCSPPVLLWL